MQTLAPFWCGEAVHRAGSSRSTLCESRHNSGIEPIFRIAQARDRSASRRLAHACVLTSTRVWAIDTSDAMPRAQHEGGLGDGLELLLCYRSGRDGVVGKRSEAAIGMEQNTARTE